MTSINLKESAISQQPAIELLQRLEQAISQHLRNQQEIAEPLIQRFKRYGVEPSSLYIQYMENRWGSCTPKDKIILNVELIKAPKSCIEYVIIHELCHLLHRNHTSAFYRLLAAEMPDWEKWKVRLERLSC
jgi:predicted metal-dependent hydrolase